jgi:hypothetical protein
MAAKGRLPSPDENEINYYKTVATLEYNSARETSEPKRTEKNPANRIHESTIIDNNDGEKSKDEEMLLLKDNGNQKLSLAERSEESHNDSSGKYNSNKTLYGFINSKELLVESLVEPKQSYTCPGNIYKFALPPVKNLSASYPILFAVANTVKKWDIFPKNPGIFAIETVVTIPRVERIASIVFVPGSTSVWIYGSTEIDSIFNASNPYLNIKIFDDQYSSYVNTTCIFNLTFNRENVMACSDLEGNLELFDFVSNENGQGGSLKMRKSFQTDSMVILIAFSDHNPTYFATAHADNTLKLWNTTEDFKTTKNKPITSSKLSAPITAIAFCQQQNYFVTATQETMSFFKFDEKGALFVLNRFKSETKLIVDSMFF